MQQPQLILTVAPAYRGLHRQRAHGGLAGGAEGARHAGRHRQAQVPRDRSPRASSRRPRPSSACSRAATSASSWSSWPEAMDREAARAARSSATTCVRRRAGRLGQRGGAPPALGRGAGAADPPVDDWRSAGRRRCRPSALIAAGDGASASATWPSAVDAARRIARDRHRSSTGSSSSPTSRRTTGCSPNRARQRCDRPLHRHDRRRSRCAPTASSHRLHHNNLYTEEDPDTAIHGGYPRGRGYLLDKLGAATCSA